MLHFEEFKQKLIDYLCVEQDMEKNDIELTKKMSRDEKIESNLMLSDLLVSKAQDNTYVLDAPDNYSKLRSGDKIVLKKKDSDTMVNALIVDVGLDSITISADKKIDINNSYDLEVDSPNLLGSLIGCLKGIVPATPGASFLRILSGEESMETDSFLALNPEEIVGYNKTFDLLNEQQQDSVRSMLQFYPIHVLQGPPGTGKTLVLAATAMAASLKNREVVIIANTHQAVNNALMKIHQLDSSVPLFKIGKLLKNEGLDDSVHQFQKFAEYNDFSRTNRKKKKYGYVIGMTIWGAISNLGLHTHSHFRPYIALVDEASLMPLTYASILGKCSSSICFFGDSRQMPPIFRPELETNSLSESILDYCATKVDGVPVKVLPETHRMNKEITGIVSKSFYEPYGITLHSADGAAGRCFNSNYMEKMGLSGSIVYMDAKLSSPNCQEENAGEACAAVKLVKALLNEGKQSNDIAIVTPFRKQVRLLRTTAKDVIATDNLPLIDTVERLQGQDVDCIILSFAASDEEFIEKLKDFLFNHNRLNVMVSRAKTKVVICCCEKIQTELKRLLCLL